MNVLQIAVPDYGEWEKRLGISTPFATWNVGDQSLLYCWLDLAFESDFDAVEFYCAKPELLQVEDLKRRMLWPIEVAVKSGPAPAGAERLESFCSGWERCPVEDEWSMLERHWKLTKDRLEVLWRRVAKLQRSIQVGRFSKVHPSAKLIEPYWIGEGCRIGAHAVIGPRVSIADCCVIGAGARIEESHIGPLVAIGEDTRLEGHFVQEKSVINRQRKVRHRRMDPQLIRSMSAPRRFEPVSLVHFEQQGGR